MKNFKDLVSEVAQPVAPEEKRFKDQHTIEVIPHPVAPDHVFSGEIPGKGEAARPADQKGDENYDKAYKKKTAQTLPQRGTGDGKDIDDVKMKKKISLRNPLLKYLESIKRKKPRKMTAKIWKKLLVFVQTSVVVLMLKLKIAFANLIVITL